MTTTIESGRLLFNAHPDPEELSRFLNEADATELPEPVTPLKHPRRVGRGSWVRQPDGSEAHFFGFSNATPEEEAWHRLNDPERGLHEEDLRAYRLSLPQPINEPGLFARLMFWLWPESVEK